MAEQFDGAIQKQFQDPQVPSAPITFGPGSEAVYETWKEYHPFLKVLRLLDHTVPQPKPLLSGQMQILPWPDKIRDDACILNWMGLVDNGCTPEMDMSGDFEGAVSEDKLQEYHRGVYIFPADSRLGNDNVIFTRHNEVPYSGSDNPNSPVYRIFFIGPLAEGRRLARVIYPNAEGLINGTSGTTLSPDGSATRAQVAAILTRFCQQYMDS